MVMQGDKEFKVAMQGDKEFKVVMQGDMEFKPKGEKTEVKEYKEGMRVKDKPLDDLDLMIKDNNHHQPSPRILSNVRQPSQTFRDLS